MNIVSGVPCIFEGIDLSKRKLVAGSKLQAYCSVVGGWGQGAVDCDEIAVLSVLPPFLHLDVHRILSVPAFNSHLSTAPNYILLKIIPIDPSGIYRQACLLLECHYLTCMFICETTYHWI